VSENTQHVWLYGALKSCEACLSDVIEELMRVRGLLALTAARVHREDQQEDENDE
jgi:hypothetical protein